MMHLVVGGQRKRIRGMRDGGKEVRETKTRVEGNTDEKYIEILWEKINEKTAEDVCIDSRSSFQYWPYCQFSSLTSMRY